jgi:FMN phosphatase YigB (HAD superfamily)
MFKKPSLVVFDLDNTLYSYSEANEAGINALISLGASETGLSKKLFFEKYQQARNAVKARLGETASSHSRLLYIHEALSRLGFANQSSLTLTLEQEFWRNYLMAMKLREGAENLLSTLRFNHIPIALVTDLTLQIQLRKITYLKIESFFDVVVASEESTNEKKSLDPFDLLFERCNTNWLEHVWFIGDSESDAPLAKLVEHNKINSGEGFLLSDKKSNEISTWRTFKEIENYFGRFN